MVTPPKPAGSELTQGSFPRPTLYNLDMAKGKVKDAQRVDKRTPMRKKGQLKAKREVCWPGRELQCNRRNETKKCGKQINSAINGECEIKRRKIGVEKGERIG